MSEPGPARVHVERASDGAPVEGDDTADLARFVAGDAGAFARLFARHAGRLLGLASRLLRDPDQAEDVVQETFLALHRKAATFRGESRVSTWLSAIALNAARMKLRRPRLAALTEEQAASLPDRSPPPDSGDLAIALARLKPDAKELLLLAAQGHSYEELAELLDLNPDQVRGRLYRARAALTAELER